MVNAQQARTDRTRRGLLARPLDSLVFLLPLILFYEAVSLSRPDRLIAFDLMRRFFELFGPAGMWAPGLAVVVILLATHLASGERWSIHWRRVGLMYAEAVGFAVLLLALNRMILPPTGVHGTTGVAGRADGAAGVALDDVAVGVGAGVYEELVFRLVFILIVVMIGVDLLKLRRGSVAVAAVVLSSLAFAAHHHRPIGMEPFSLLPFTFRTIAGTYLAMIFWFRGYGPAAGCHAAYNVALAFLG